MSKPEKILSNPHFQAILRPFCHADNPAISNDNRVVRSYIYDLDPRVSRHNHVAKASIKSFEEEEPCTSAGDT